VIVTNSDIDYSINMDSKRILAVAIIGKQNEPLFFTSIGDTSIFGYEYLHLQMIAHSSLDIVEEKRKKATSSKQAMGIECYLGLLCAIDDYKVFGYYSNTHIKTIVICEALTAENHARDFINTVNNLYITALHNPFQQSAKPITSKSFAKSIQDILMRNNMNTSPLPKSMY